MELELVVKMVGFEEEAGGGSGGCGGCGWK